MPYRPLFVEVDIEAINQEVYWVERDIRLSKGWDAYCYQLKQLYMEERYTYSLGLLTNLSATL